MVSRDHRRVVASAEAERRYLGGLAEPPTGSNATEYTGPLCPISLRVVDPPFSRILLSDETEPQLAGNASLRYERNTNHRVLNLSGNRSASLSASHLSDSIGGYSFPRSPPPTVTCLARTHNTARCQSVSPQRHRHHKDTRTPRRHHGRYMHICSGAHALVLRRLAGYLHSPSLVQKGQDGFVFVRHGLSPLHA